MSATATLPLRHYEAAKRETLGFDGLSWFELAEVKSFMRIADADESQDTLLGQLADRALSVVEQMTGRPITSLASGTVEYGGLDAESTEMLLDRSDIDAVTAVTLYDRDEVATELEDDGYEVRWGQGRAVLQLLGDNCLEPCVPLAAKVAYNLSFADTSDRNIVKALVCDMVHGAFFHGGSLQEGSMRGNPEHMRALKLLRDRRSYAVLA